MKKEGDNFDMYSLYSTVNIVFSQNRRHNLLRIIVTNMGQGVAVGLCRLNDNIEDSLKVP